MAPLRKGWRGRPARERGLHENNIIVLVLALPCKALSIRVLHRRPSTGSSRLSPTDPGFDIAISG